MRVLLLAAIAGCSGGATQIAIAPPPPRQTQGPLAGPLCTGDHCTCREANAAGDAGVGLPEGAAKRFEVRLGPSPQQLWVKIGPNVLYKSAERPEECFYVDLAAGQIPVELRASDPSGVSAAWSIHELGSKTRSWYDTFTFNCGSPGVCSFDELDGQKQRFAGYKHGVEDLCGSVKIKGLSWDTGKSPDMLHPDELLVRLVLDIYRRAPTQSHGDESCGKGPPPEDVPDAPQPVAPAP
ncbi:MAG TPA: hypothetical protein VLX92_22950 [Kofleriaceae bacterium]|nr:hypothetical protein [Kofleriaceae bacterium]